MSQAHTVESARPVLFFDANCLLCDGSVRFILRHERQPIINFAPINGSTWRNRFGADGESGPPQTVVFVDDFGVHTKSEAVLRIQKNMGGVWAWLSRLGAVVPRSVRDFLYDIIARHRYTWFGRTDECLLLPPETRERFLE